MKSLPESLGAKVSGISYREMIGAALCEEVRGRNLRCYHDVTQDLSA